MIIYVDMDDVLCDFTGAHRRELAKNPTMPYPQAQHGFFQRLKPLDGAVEAMKTLYASEGYTPYILTTPSLKNPFSYLEKRVWTEENLGFDFVERLIICPNKSLLRGDLLIDDNKNGKGQEGFLGKLIHFGSEEFIDWNAVRISLKFWFLKDKRNGLIINNQNSNIIH